MLLNAIYLLSPVLLVMLLISRKKGVQRGIWLYKLVLSLAFVLCAVLNAQRWDVFEQLILCGFFLCFLGDVLLIPENKSMFTIGLLSFLSGHLFYVGAFLSLANVAGVVFDQAFVLTVIACVLVLVMVLVMRWLRVYLQAMLLPVSCYVLVISGMVFAACLLALDQQIALMARVLIIGGALAFFVSDLFVVRQRFVHMSFTNPLIGLPLYYGGQFALAISLAYID